MRAVSCGEGGDNNAGDVNEEINSTPSAESFTVVAASASASTLRAFLLGRLPGCAGAGLLQVRALALIPCGDGLAAAFRIPDAGGFAARTSTDQTCKTASRFAGEGARRAAVPDRVGLGRGCRFPAFFAL
jgi:hypothetical protein